MYYTEGAFTSYRFLPNIETKNTTNPFLLPLPIHRLLILPPQTILIMSQVLHGLYVRSLKILGVPRPLVATLVSPVDLAARSQVVKTQQAVLMALDHLDQIVIGLRVGVVVGFAARLVGLGAVVDLVC